MRHDTRDIGRVSKQPHFTLRPRDLEPQQIVILVDIHSRLPRISILCTFVCYEEEDNKITVLVANGLLAYLYPNGAHVADPDGLDDLITFSCCDVLIHHCTD